jgi:broad specificity phosphatase PhoE
VSNALEIRLVRHGLSAHQPPPGRVTAGEFHQWLDVYNHTGLSPTSYPPPNIVAAVSEFRVVVCSDLPRSIESAGRLLPEVDPHTSPLFREAGRPLAFNGKLRLSLSMWDHISVALWRNGVVSGDESIAAARKRAKAAAQVLVRFSEEAGRVLCVAHGTFNALVAIELKALGWEGPDRVSDMHWEGATYQRII